MGSLFFGNNQEINTGLLLLLMMEKKFLLVFACVVLVASMAWAVPNPVTNMNSESFGFNSIKITWDHEGGATSFKTYRGASINNMQNIGSSTERFYIDQGIDLDKEYLYFVTAIDSSGESSFPLYALSITQTASSAKPFTISLVSPIKKVFSFGEKVYFVVNISSYFFGELEGLEAVLINKDYGLEKPMAFDAGKNTFSLSETMPSSESKEEFSTTYLVRVSGTIDGNPFSESESHLFTLVPKPVYFPEMFVAFVAEALLLFSPVFVLLALAIIIAFSWRKYHLKKIA